MNKFDKLELVKFPKLDEVDESIFQKSIERFFSKINFKKDDELVLTYKSYSKGGLRKQHDVKAKLVLSGDVFSASETGWKLLETVQIVLKKLEKEVLKKHSS